MAEGGAQCGDLAAGTCHLTILVILAVPPCSTFLNKDGFGMALELPQSLEKQGIFHIARLRWLPFFWGMPFPVRCAAGGVRSVLHPFQAGYSILLGS